MGLFQVDAYAGFNPLYALGRVPGPVTECLCWAHGRRKSYELADIAASKRRGTGAAPVSPLALEAVQRLDALFGIEVLSLRLPCLLAGFAGARRILVPCAGLALRSRPAHRAILRAVFSVLGSLLVGTRVGGYGTFPSTEGRQASFIDAERANWSLRRASRSVRFLLRRRRSRLPIEIGGQRFPSGMPVWCGTSPSRSGPVCTGFPLLARQLPSTGPPSPLARAGAAFGDARRAFGLSRPCHRSAV